MSPSYPGGQLEEPRLGPKNEAQKRLSHLPEVVTERQKWDVALTSAGTARTLLGWTKVAGATCPIARSVLSWSGGLTRHKQRRDADHLGRGSWLQVCRAREALPRVGTGQDTSVTGLTVQLGQLRTNSREHGNKPDLPRQQYVLERKESNQSKAVLSVRGKNFWAQESGGEQIFRNNSRFSKTCLGLTTSSPRPAPVLDRTGPSFMSTRNLGGGAGGDRCNQVMM